MRAGISVCAPLVKSLVVLGMESGHCFSSEMEVSLKVILNKTVLELLLERMWLFFIYTLFSFSTQVRAV